MSLNSIYYISHFNSMQSTMEEYRELKKSQVTLNVVALNQKCLVTSFKKSHKTAFYW